jgi:hypothetical protein
VCALLVCACSLFLQHTTAEIFLFWITPRTEKILPLVVVVVSWRCEEKTRAKTIAQKINKKPFFSEATFHIHKFSTFSPYSTCLLVLRCVIKFFPLSPLAIPFSLAFLPAASLHPSSSFILSTAYIFLWKIRKNYLKKKAKNGWY